MNPNDIPDGLIETAQDAWRHAPQKRDGQPTRMRHALAAAWPEIERIVREQVATAAAAQLEQTTREWSAHEDDHNTCDAADEHNCHVVGGEAAFNEAIRQVRQIAGGETR